DRVDYQSVKPDRSHHRPLHSLSHPQSGNFHSSVWWTRTHPVHLPRQRKRTALNVRRMGAVNNAVARRASASWLLNMCGWLMPLQHQWVVVLAAPEISRGGAKPVNTRLPPRKNSPNERVSGISHPSLCNPGSGTLSHEMCFLPVSIYRRKACSWTCQRYSGIIRVSLEPMSSLAAHPNIGSTEALQYKIVLSSPMVKRASDAASARSRNCASDWVNASVARR